MMRWRRHRGLRRCVVCTGRVGVLFRYGTCCRECEADAVADAAV